MSAIDPQHDLRSRTRELVGQLSPLGPQTAESEARLAEDLGYDSLALIELSLRLESEFGFGGAGSVDTADISTVGDIEDLVSRAVGAQTA